jgi:long-chain acyl-CoA synthetase
VLLHELYREALASHPDKIAVVCGPDRCSFRELEESSVSYARALISIGVGRSGLVGIFSRNSLDVVRLYLACFRIGAIAVPISCLIRAPEVAYEVAHSGLRVLLASAELASEVRGLRETVPTLERFLVIDGPVETTEENWQAVVRGATASLPPVVVEESDPAIILYTSGSTDRPKGVTHTHASMTQLAINRCSTFRHTADHIFLATGQVCHAAALGVALFPMWLAGGISVFMPNWNVEEWLEMMNCLQPTHAAFFPSQLVELLARPETRTAGYNSLEYCAVGGDVAARELQERFREITGLELSLTLGMTECGGYITTSPFDRSKSGSLGKPIHGFQVRLLGPDGCDVPPDAPGEIAVKSGSVMSGYWNDPEATDRAFANGWMQTGDIARRDDDGYYYFVGRIKEMIIRDAGNIGPGEVENAICEHPAVRRCGVIGLPDLRHGQAVHAFVELKKDCCPPPTVQELTLFASRMLAERKVPEFWTIIDELPCTAAGKVDRKALRLLAC